jgi:hypothetical protein
MGGSRRALPAGRVAPQGRSKEDPAHHRDLLVPMPPSHRVGAAVGGAALDPSACAGSPCAKRLQPLLPETRSRNSWNFSSIHNPIVVFAVVAPGSICHHLQSWHGPHSDFAIASPFRDAGSFRHPRSIRANAAPMQAAFVAAGLLALAARRSPTVSAAKLRGVEPQFRDLHLRRHSQYAVAGHRADFHGQLDRHGRRLFGNQRHEHRRRCQRHGVGRRAAALILSQRPDAVEAGKGNPFPPFLPRAWIPQRNKSLVGSRLKVPPGKFTMSALPGDGGGSTRETALAL